MIEENDDLNTGASAEPTEPVESTTEPVVPTESVEEDLLPVDPSGEIKEGMRWYAVHAASNYEMFVKNALVKRIEELGMQESFGRILVPIEKIVEMRQGKKRESSKKFYPGYVLMQIEMDNDSWYLVRKTPKVLGFIGGRGDKPAPIPEKEVTAILSRIEESADKPKPKVLFETGEVVRVTEGPFADFNGVVEEVNYEKSRLRVAVLIFGRSTPVELEFSQVEKG